jgi:predicted GNAT superfamily acetyltransferase
VSDAGGFSIRELADHAELDRCVAFQKIIWGPDFAELVPAAILMVATRTGGIVAGAFDDDRTAATGRYADVGSMVGFLFGITGFRDGAPIHWSDMLGVRPDRRGRGIGQALKRFQRDLLLRRGIAAVRWTFDPLDARTAFINFVRLGCTAREYARDLYGAGTSPLHVGLGTDRLIVDWQLDAPAVRQRMDGGRAAATPTPTLPPAHIRVRIPADILALRDAEPARAAEWRLRTRAAFETHLAAGRVVTDFVPDAAGGGSYILVDAASAVDA